MKSLTKYLYLISIFFIISCESKEDLCADSTFDCINVCGNIVEVNPSIYNTLPPISHRIDAISIEGNCLNIIIENSGCDGSQWEVKLIDSGDIAESLPVQRFLKVTLSNPESCKAIIRKEFSFDLDPIRIDEEDKIILNIQEYPEQVIFE